MISIYCLVDPRNNRPFYVGATKVLLKNRLSGHIHDAAVFQTTQFAKPFTNHKKHLLIKELISQSLKPRIDLLYTCSFATTNYYEYFFFSLLTAQGFEIFNRSHSFNYQQHIGNNKYLSKIPSN